MPPTASPAMPFPRPDGTAPPQGLWYGWVVLAVIFAVMSVIVGMRNSLGFFFKTVSGEFGWTRAETAGAYSIGMLMQALCSPLFGALGERWSLRWMIAGGVCVAGAAFLIGPFLGGLWQFYLMYAILNLGFAASTYIPQVQLLSNWFIRRRGLAMGLSNAGQGFASVLSLAVPGLIALVGWRYGYLVLAVFTLLLVFPPAALLLRDHPWQKGTWADAPFLSAAEREAAALRQDDPASRSGDPAPAGGSYWRRVFSLRFVLIGATYSAVAFFFTSTTVHIVPHATDQGLTPAASGLIFLLFGLAMMGGNLVSGISDTLGRGTTYTIGAALGSAACLLIAFFTLGMPPTWLYAGAALAGAGLGLTRPTASALLADQFAGPGFGRLNGSVMTFFALSGALGAFLTGYLFDVTGSYRIAFLLLAAITLAGAIVATALSRMGRPPGAG